MHIKKTIAIIANALGCALFLFCACAASVRLPAQTPAPDLATALAAPIVTITGKRNVPAGARPQDYVSYSSPGMSQPGGDYARLWAFFDTVETLAGGWRDNHDDAAAKRASEWLRAWLVAPATRMNPNLDYAASVVDGRGFGRIIGNIQDLDNAPALTAADKEALHQWFNTYLEWLMTSKSGMAARAAQNSDGTWFVAQALPIAVYAGRDYLAHALLEEAQKRIGVQIMHDGSQPQELLRADSLSYSAFNLAAYAQIAKAAAPLGVDLWKYVSPSHATLGRAVDFLVPYNSEPSRWTHPQRQQLQPGFLNEIIKASGVTVNGALPQATSLPVPAFTAVAIAPAIGNQVVASVSGVSGVPSVANGANGANGFGAREVPNVSYESGVSEAAGVSGALSVPNVSSIPSVSSVPGVVGVVSIPSASSGASVGNVGGVGSVSGFSSGSGISGALNAPAGVNFVLQKDGLIFLNGKIVLAGQLAPMILQAKAASPNAPVFISADGNTPISTISAVMDACRKQGLTRISLQMQ